MGWGEPGFTCWGCQEEAHTHVIILRERMVSLVLQDFDDTSSLGSPHQVVYPPV